MTPTDAANVAIFLKHCIADQGQPDDGKQILGAVVEHLTQAAANGVPSGVEAEICQMIATRQRDGIQKYGQTVADNPLPLRAWLQHALEECLDQAVYLKRAINEIDAK